MADRPRECRGERARKADQQVVTPALVRPLMRHDGGELRAVEGPDRREIRGEHSEPADDPGVAHS